jgi:Fe-S-cluster containining protein
MNCSPLEGTLSNQITSVEALEDHLEIYFSELGRIHSEQQSDALACGAGCSFCCHLHITLKPYELLPLIDHINQLEETAKEKVLERVESNYRRMELASDDEILLINYDCPFLDEGNCSVYNSRPTSCRTAHSTSKETCEEAYNYPTLEIEANHLEGFAEPIRQYEAIFEELLGEYHDVSDYNMNCAIRAALKDPRWINRFLDGEEVFDDSVLSRV